MSLPALTRMVIVPAALALAVGALLRPLGPVAVLLGLAFFVVVQLAVLARSHWQLEAARRRLAASRAAHRKQLRLQRRA